MNAPYIGKSVPRANARRLLQGRGTYTDDLRIARLAHAVFFRSPHAHARIVKLDLAKARTLPGVVAVVEETYEFGRHTGVTLEGRAILADYNAAEHTLTVHQSTQAPHMMQDIFSRHLDIPEGNQVVNLTGGPYRHQQYRAKLNVVFTNKNVTCQYRAVGHPIAVAITEAIVDLAANKLGIYPAEFRRRNLVPDDAYLYTSASGMKMEKLSHHQSLTKLLALMNYDALRTERANLRQRGVYRGIGLAAMIEVTNPSPAFYGVGGARISSQDGAKLRLEPTGMVTCLVSVTEQGQGTEGIFAQIAVGVSVDRVRVITGDTGITPYGGGTWASRGAGIGGEAVLQSGKVLRANILDVAGVILQSSREMLDLRDNNIVDARSGEVKLSLTELGRVAYFRPDTLPMDFQSELMVTRHYTPRGYGFAFTNGIQASLVEVDIETGFVKLLKH